MRAIIQIAVPDNTTEANVRRLIQMIDMTIQDSGLVPAPGHEIGAYDNANGKPIEPADPRGWNPPTEDTVTR